MLPPRLRSRSRSAVPLAAALLIGLTQMPLRAAERVSFRFGELERSVRVADLADFVNQGVITEEDRFILASLNPSDRHALRFALGKAFHVTSLEVADFLQSPMGGVVIRQFAKLGERPESEAVPALSSALILAAANSKGLRLIDVLAQYPLENLIINVPTLHRLAHRLTDQFELESDLFSRLAALGPPSKGSTTTLEVASQAGQQPYQRHGFTFVGRDGNTIQSVALIPRSSRTSASVSKPRPAPLIVLAPGLNTDFNALLYVGDHLASHGYAVAALDFPFTSANRVSAAIQGLATIPPPNAWYSQPLNVSRLIDALAARWPGQIDSRRVGVLGQSLGGYTVLALGGAQLDWKNLERACAVVNDPNQVEFNPAVLWQCKDPSDVVKRADFSDPRIKAVVAVNPVSNPVFTAEAIQTLRTPVLIVSGTADVFAPPLSQQLIPYTSVGKATSVLAVFDKATHLSFLAATGKLPAWLIGPVPEQAQRDLKALSLAFFDQQLLGKDTMGGLMPSDAALYRAGQPLQFLLKRQLTPGQLRAIDPILSPATQ